MQLVRGAALVGQQEQAEPDLCDEERLREREQVRDDAPRAAPAPVDEAADGRGQRRHRDHEVGERVCVVSIARTLARAWGDRVDE